MTAGGRIRLGAMGAAILALVLSALLNFGAFARWPGAPDGDVHHSVYAGQNFLSTGKPLSLNLYPDPVDDLARHAEPRWMTHWPPLHGWLYAAVMAPGLSPGGATKVLGLLAVLTGGLGVIALMRALGASPLGLALAGAAYPWVWFMARVQLDYKNDHWACAIAPWIFLALLRIEPLAASSRERWPRLVLAAFLVGLSVLVKYSMAPIPLAAGLYLLWLDGLDLSPRRIARLGVAGAVVCAPAAAFVLFNLVATQTSYPMQPGSGLAFAPPTFLKNIVVSTAGAPLGFNMMLTQIGLLLRERAGLGLPGGLLFVASAAAFVVFGLFLRRVGVPGLTRRLLVLMAIATGVLWLLLAVMTIKSGAQYDYASDMRFYLPIALGWAVLIAARLASVPRKGFLWGASLAALAVPILFSLVFFGAQGLTARPFATMPMGQMAYPEYVPDAAGRRVLARQDPAHARFLADLVAARGRKPDLSVVDGGWFLTELAVPAYYDWIAASDDGRTYYSSRDLEVWALVAPSQEAVLLRKFSRAVRRERIATPEGFPYVVWILDFAAEPPPAA